MRFILLHKSNPKAEAGIPPTTARIQASMSWHSEMNSAGIILAAEGLQPSSTGARVTFHAPSTGAPPTVVRGPFTPVEELLFCYWIINVKDLEEALEWAKKCPLEEEGASIEIRRVGELDDYDFTGSVMEGIKKEVERMKKETEERFCGARQK
jgi:hypothetical protein